MDIRDVIARRSDLSTFLVHLTREIGGMTARARLEAILGAWTLQARSTFGAAITHLGPAAAPLESQKCVCFTETPLEHVRLLLEEIEGRAVQFSAYGIAFPKKVGRARAVNPVWYLDITPAGHDWLTNPLNEIIVAAIAGPGGLDGASIHRLTPFIEQMGTRWNSDGTLGYRKEFWWEREWRHVGDFSLPNRVIVLCPEDEFPHFEGVIDGLPPGRTAAIVDPRWGLEQIISRLAGYGADETEML